MIFLPVFITLSVLGGAAVIASVVCERRARKRAGFMLLAAAYVPCVYFAAAGMSFSPSYTAIFAFVSVVLCVVGELIGTLARSATKFPLLALARFPFTVMGAVFAVPAIIVYAAQDDRLTACVFIAAFGCVALGALCVYLTKKRPFGLYRAFETAEYLFFGFTALLALGCGLFSVALFPYGLGFALMLIGRVAGGETTRRATIAEVCHWAGVYLTVLLAAVPAVV